MGSSTALHLARRGFTNIRVLDVWDSPSADSAGNDLNKVRSDSGLSSCSC
jgi:sarcosine oxidase/sarcosine oxidase/L-pipecolate oxidase